MLTGNSQSDITEQHFELCLMYNIRQSSIEFSPTGSVVQIIEVPNKFLIGQHAILGQHAFE